MVLDGKRKDQKTRELEKKLVQERWGGWYLKKIQNPNHGLLHPWTRNPTIVGPKTPTPKNMSILTKIYTTFKVSNRFPKMNPL